MDIHELFIGNNTPSPLLAALALSLIQLNPNSSLAADHRAAPTSQRYSPRRPHSRRHPSRSRCRRTSQPWCSSTSVETEDQPSAKRRLFSAVVKLDGEEVREDLGAEDSKEEDPRVEASVVTNGERDEHKASYLRSNGVGFRKDGISRTRMTDFDMALPEPTPSESKLIQDANLVNRN
ncbi:hypothetical protein MUK42_09133 [Musa troglodytarum]|uniref:Uncharacterized protein n=1 Tax=Musa troglodytarum TaxID=320322 RepID=A0A9E7G590_9LILI|nr:hypothetical protein MUK42_09133 [Musa troglodytarum]URE05298.1 hypothetical protein MUK42_09133 [Musa troglodytarum]